MKPLLILPDRLMARVAPWFWTVKADWNGNGRLIGHHDKGDPVGRHRGWTRGADPPAGPFGTLRCTLVYLPPDYDPDRPAAYPVLYALHGYGSRPDIWVRTLLPVLEESIDEGRVPPVVVVMPDFSLSGNGAAEGPWPGDGRAGSWYIDSNTGAFREYFFEILRPWVARKYHVRTDAAGTALLGSSMGGTGALYYSVTTDVFSNTIAALYPMADLRYAVAGSRLAAYDPVRYSPITSDRPRRAMMGLDGIGLFGVAEEFFTGQVFGTRGSRWPPEMPLWKRMQSVSPLDILKTGGRDLTGVSYYITCGGKDEFNFHNHLPLIVPELKRHGAEVTSRVRPGRHHGWWETGSRAGRREIVDWIGAGLQAAGD